MEGCATASASAKATVAAGQRHRAAGAQGKESNCYERRQA
jgi:hypothetical protein